MGFKNSRLERRFIWREESQRKVSDVEARRAAVLLEWIRKRGREKDFGLLVGIRAGRIEVVVEPTDVLNGREGKKYDELMSAKGTAITSVAGLHVRAICQWHGWKRRRKN